MSLKPPTAESLLSVRTPAQLALSPHGGSIAFALQATVADVGSFPPSDIYVLDRRGADNSQSPTQLTSGGDNSQAPTWSSDGARLAFLSDRVTPGHHLPYTMSADGRDQVLAATLIGSAESVSWSHDDSSLLVLAADPGSYGLDWSARAVNGAGEASDPIVRRPGDARRRLFLIDVNTQSAREVGPPDVSVWAVDWDGAENVVAVISKDHSGSGWYQGEVAALDLGKRTATVLYRPQWQTEGLCAVARWLPRCGRRGIRQRPRAGLRKHDAD